MHYFSTTIILICLVAEALSNAVPALAPPKPMTVSVDPGAQGQAYVVQPTPPSGLSIQLPVSTISPGLTSTTADSLPVITDGPETLGDGLAEAFLQTTYYTCVTYGPGRSHCGIHEPILDASLSNAASTISVAGRVGLIVAVVASLLVMA